MGKKKVRNKKLNPVKKIIGIVFVIAIIAVLIALFNKEEVTKIATEITAKNALSDINVNAEYSNAEEEIKTIASDDITQDSNGVYVMPDSYYEKIKSITTLQLNQDTLTNAECASGISKITNSNAIGFVADIKENNNSFYYDSPLTLTFTNVGTIGGRQLNATVTITSISYEKPYDSDTANTTGDVLFCYMTETKKLWLGSQYSTYFSRV